MPGPELRERIEDEPLAPPAAQRAVVDVRRDGNVQPSLDGPPEARLHGFREESPLGQRGRRAPSPAVARVAEKGHARVLLGGPRGAGLAVEEVERRREHDAALAEGRGAVDHGGAAGGVEAPVGLGGQDDLCWGFGFGEEKVAKRS